MYVIAKLINEIIMDKIEADRVIFTFNIYKNKFIILNLNSLKI